MKKFIISIIIILAALIAGMWYFSYNTNSTNNTNAPQNAATQTNINNSQLSNIVNGQTNNSLNNPGGAGNVGPSTKQISIENFAFSPSTLTINKGDTVIWTNKDSAPHTVTSDSGSELDSSRLSNGQTYSHTFNNAGDFSYYCMIHTGMKGKIIVK